MDWLAVFRPDLSVHVYTDLFFLLIKDHMFTANYHFVSHV